MRALEPRIVDVQPALRNQEIELALFFEGEFGDVYSEGRAMVAAYPSNSGAVMKMVLAARHIRVRKIKILKGPLKDASPDVVADANSGPPAPREE